MVLSAVGSVSGWLLHLHGAPAYVLVSGLVFAEAALLVGFVVPGETAVVVGGVLASVGSVHLWAIMALAALAAVLGDTAGFTLGRIAGPWLLARWPLRGRAAVDRTRAFLERFGGPAVFIGRFVTFARAVVPGVAGMSRLRYRTFVVFNVLGGIIWAVAYTLIGYLLGRSFVRITSDLRTVSLIVLCALVGALAAFARRRRRRGPSPAVVTATGEDGPGGAGAGREPGSAPVPALPAMAEGIR